MKKVHLSAVPIAVIAWARELGISKLTVDPLNA